MSTCLIQSSTNGGQFFPQELWVSTRFALTTHNQPHERVLTPMEWMVDTSQGTHGVHYNNVNNRELQYLASRRSEHPACSNSHKHPEQTIMGLALIPTWGGW